MATPAADIEAIMGWREFWNTDHAIYVNDRHRQFHARVIRDGILDALGKPDLAVLDYGCGEALYAEELAARCHSLVLCDGAPSVVDKLKARMVGKPGVAVCLPEQLDSFAAPNSLDLIIMCSVAQYLTRDEMVALLGRFHALLKTGGRLIIADLIDPKTGIVDDTTALLGAAAGNGFLLAALKGLVATTFSAYPKLRKQYGLTRYGEDDITALLRAAGYRAARATRNIGFNQHRLTMVASKAGETTP